ncbi:MAG: Nif3-like dinuclear metal center hexameric protein [Coriobacteriia bacterium]|nr:Nif3-like dinuclear metal center hexameric protein [Coriobacteriia bacterium]
MTGQGPVTVGGFVDSLFKEFPLAWAEPWDRVGLVVGDANAPVRSILVTLDADRATVRRAADGGHDVVLTHHPAALDVELPLVAEGRTAVLVDALKAGIALVSFHTNLDRSPLGAEALPRLLGMRVIEPLEAAQEPSTVITTFAPLEVAEGLRTALAAAGAGRVGLYSACSFSSLGTGCYSAPRGSKPVVGAVDSNMNEEVRIETTCSPEMTAAVISAIRAAHPYKEPLITSVVGSVSRGVARLGRLCELDTVETLLAFASRCATSLEVDARVWGDPERPIRRIGVGNGSAGSLIDRAIALGADALLAGEVRYHDARAAIDAGLSIVEAGHDATEWPLVHILAQAAVAAVSGLAQVTEEDPSIAWWTTERH